MYLELQTFAQVNGSNRKSDSICEAMPKWVIGTGRIPAKSTRQVSTILLERKHIEY